MSATPSVAADGDASENASSDDPGVVTVAKDGDIVLEVTFETSPATLKKNRQAAALAVNGRLSATTTRPPAMTPKPATTLKVAYRVSVQSLSRHSRYFENLFSNHRFREARLIADAHAKLSLTGIKPAKADVRDLPVVTVVDDDQATEAAGRELAFEDMLSVIHEQPARNAKPLMSYALTMAIIADRFDCVAVVARALNHELKFKWPMTSNRPFIDDAGHHTQVEQVLRQKVLVSWLLGQAMRLQQSTRELIMRGSRLWSAFHEADSRMSAAWWNLPGGLEDELQYRRECILNTISSVQRHFLDLYSSRDRQCKLGYDTSAACDIFQLGQLHRFLKSKELLFLVDYSQSSLDAVPDTAHLDLEELIATLKQCPNYQVDKHHVNCGPQLRMKAILDYMRTMLSANVVSISHADWKKRRAQVSWKARKEKAHLEDDDGGRTFAFTRAIANDERLRYDGVMHADRMALSLFTADAWNWTPEA
ncbi:hypothetical protein PLIIFM63780_008487 [Purpureocillium lilacinum]|nr:hypothetical protein PLIIFM63780_008487 [Purpureocillium lilacinum]